MIHGLPGSSRYFQPQRYLPAFDVRTPDLPGYGSKRTTEAGIDLDGRAGEIVRILREEVGWPAWLLGHSVGGELSASGWDVPEWVLALARGSLAQAKTGHMMMLEDPAAFLGIVSELLAQERDTRTA